MLAFPAKMRSALLALFTASTLVITGCVDSKDTVVTFGTITEVQDAYNECMTRSREEENARLREQLYCQCREVFNRAVAYKEKVLETNPNKTKGPFNVKVTQHGIKLQLTDAEGKVLMKLGEGLAPLVGAARVVEPVPGDGAPPPGGTPRLGQLPSRGELRSSQAQQFFYGIATVKAAGNQVGRFFLFPLETTRGDDGWYTHKVTFWPAPDWAAYANSGFPLEMDLVVDVGIDTDTVPLDVNMVEAFDIGGTTVPWASYSFALRTTDGPLLQTTIPVDSAGLETAVQAWNPPISGRQWYFRDTTGQPFEALFNTLARLDIYRGYPDATAHPEADITRAEFAAVAVRVMNQERLATELRDRRPDYSDEVPRWAWGYINAATRLGIMQGFPDGTVGAGLPVTNVQSWTIMIRALGADQDRIARALGIWPENYTEAARRLNLTAGQAFDANRNASRANVALFAYQTLFTDLRLGADGQPVPGQPALAGEALGVTRVAAEVQSVDTVQESVTLDHAIGDLGATLNLAAAFSMAGTPFPGDLVGRNAFVYLRGGEVIGLEVRP